LEERARRRATAIKNQFRKETFSVEDKKFSELTCSAGIGETGGEMEKAKIAANVHGLYNNLFQYLYQAKQGGGNAVVGSSKR